MVKIMDNPYEKMGWFGGENPPFSETTIWKKTHKFTNHRGLNLNDYTLASSDLTVGAERAKPTLVFGWVFGRFRRAPSPQKKHGNAT